MQAHFHTLQATRESCTPGKPSEASPAGPAALSSAGRAEPGADTRSQVREFAPKQIELVERFADQAGITIENVGLFDEVQAKTLDLEESLTFQKAIGDVLEVVGRSASKAQPVLDIIVETAASLCRADRSTLRLLKEGGFHFAASNSLADRR